ncbi:hypothetical protein GYMLUDRAFT_250328 [Collybiopsis luxurians FD-317 M1]|uniref:Uncharacterized protein n=1 Tax=Collybiopsis luxurians FD-317 M1 TaxID=944289 RepID=A0A0D0ASZ3_9AGAR|nr:hypothetical protein GYMLUDRAFT_250328 [Collybiopsis luxurians FD-317 M1]
MLSFQAFPDQPIASSSASGGSKPQLIIKPPQPAQPSVVVPLSNALGSVPLKDKKMQHTAFECSALLQYPAVPVSLNVSSPLPTNVQSIFDNAYLANSSPEELEQVPADEWRRIFGQYPACKYCTSHGLHSSCSLHLNSLLCSTCESNYATSKKFCSFKSVSCLLQFHILAKLRLVVAYRYASSCRFFAIWDEEWTAITTGLQTLPYYQDHLEELGLVLEKLRSQGVKRKADDDVEMEVLEELDGMNLDYPEEVPPPPTPVPTAPAPIWKAVNTQSYSEVSSLKTWFFEPLVKQVPSDGSSLTWDKMIQTAIKCVVTRIALLFAGPRKKMLKQDLWALVDGMIQGAFTGLKEQLQHSPYKPPASFSKQSKAENLHLQEQVGSHDVQLKHKDEELIRLKSFVQHFMGNFQSTEVQQLRGAMEAQESEVEELKKKLAASEEAHQVAAEELKLQDEELAQL